MVLGISPNDTHGLFGRLIPLLAPDSLVDGLQRGLVARHLGDVGAICTNNRLMTPQAEGELQDTGSKVQ